MLIHHTKERPDLNDGEKHEQKRSALAVMLALHRVRAHSPIKTVRVPK